MAMLSPVPGLVPWRALRNRVEKVPNPAIETFSPDAGATAANTVSTAVAASVVDSDAAFGDARA